MPRSPYQLIEHWETPTNRLDQTVGVQPSHRMRRALQSSRQRDVIDLAPLAPALLPSQGLSVLTATGAGTLVLPPRIGFRNGVTQVPGLDPQQRFPISAIDFSRRDVPLPYGIPRHVNAATLKVIAGGRRFDSLLKRTGSGWEFVEDKTVIDLRDGSQEFRLGRLTIFS